MFKQHEIGPHCHVELFVCRLQVEVCCSYALVASWIHIFKSMWDANFKIYIVFHMFNHHETFFTVYVKSFFWILINIDSLKPHAIVFHCHALWCALECSSFEVCCHYALAASWICAIGSAIGFCRRCWMCSCSCSCWCGRCERSQNNQLCCRKDQ